MALPPLVSVITPTYNHEKFIASCIQSVIAQSFSAWEMVIINDGSTDGTAEIIGEFARQDERIRVFNRANVGIDRLSETYNFGLEQCRGRFIAILEGDDLWEPEKLHLQVAAMGVDVALQAVPVVAPGNNNTCDLHSCCCPCRAHQGAAAASSKSLVEWYVLHDVQQRWSRQQ